MKIRTWAFTGFVCSVFLSISASADLVPTHSEIPNFHQENAFVSRGARPTEAGMRFLAEAHYKTDIDLEDDIDAVNQESAWAKQMGVNFASFPVNSYTTPSDALIEQILELMSSARAQPVFVHCHFGDNRTGLIMALYRVKFDGWTPEAAYQEMIQDGLTLGGRLLLLPYFEKVTGFTPSSSS